MVIYSHSTQHIQRFTLSRRWANRGKGLAPNYSKGCTLWSVRRRDGPASTPVAVVVMPEAQITNLCSRCTGIMTFLQMPDAAFRPLAHHSQKWQLDTCKQNRDCAPVITPGNTIRPKISYYSCLCSRIRDLSSPVHKLITWYQTL